MQERLDHRVICSMVEQGARVLDLGCGDGSLMSLLARERSASVQGIELDGEALHRCVERGLTVFQDDIEGGLADYPENSFDVVILNQSMQEVRKVDLVISESLRVGRLVIVGFPNFAHLASRCRMFFQGRSPVTQALPYFWYETPNVRFLSIRDFRDFCGSKGLKILNGVYLGAGGMIAWFPNLLARNAIFAVTR